MTALDEARRQLNAAENTIAEARCMAAPVRNAGLRGQLIATQESISAAQRCVHEARGSVRDLLSRIARLEADCEYWKQVAERRFAS